MKTLLRDALSQLAPECLPAGSQSLQIQWINAVAATFYIEGKFAGTTAKWRGRSTGAAFSIFYDPNTGQPYVTLPRNMLSLLAAAYGTTNGEPAYNARFSTSPVNGPWFQFMNGSFGVGEQIQGRGVQDAGDGWTTFRDVTEPSYLRVVPSEQETAGATILLRGLDQNFNEIYSGSGSGTIQGVTLALDGGAGSSPQTTQVFGLAPSLIQKPATFGPVSLYSVSVATGVATLVGVYDPGDTAPGFRRYKLGGISITPGQTPLYTTLHAMVKRRFVPAVSMADEIIPGNLQALELGLLARQCDLQKEPETAEKYWIDAIQLLNSELAEFNGSAVPRLNFQRGTNLAQMPYIH